MRQIICSTTLACAARVAGRFMAGRFFTAAAGIVAAVSRNLRSQIINLQRKASLSEISNHQPGPALSFKGQRNTWNRAF
jgi:hypothetical protein